jgi:hypothetical protein
MVLPVQGVAHHHFLKEVSAPLTGVVLAGPVEEHAAVADVPDGPVRGRGGEEGEGEVGGDGDGAACPRGGVRWYRGLEAALVEEAEERRGVELAVAPEE